VNSSDNAAYRLALAEGFLAEAEQDFKLERWRSCADNAQLAVENAGKTVLALFAVTSKTHEPARQVAALLRTQTVPAKVQERLQILLSNLLALGASEYFQTDYGDEATYTLPWDLFTRESAIDALEAARRSFALVQELVPIVSQWRQQ
jgi:HEPN domain-containing protein